MDSSSTNCTFERFADLRDKAFDYLLKPSQLYHNKGLEKMNILNELVARVQETHSNSLSALVNTESSTSNFWDIWSWFEKMKAIGFGTILFIVTLLTVWIIVKIVPFRRIISDLMPNNTVENVNVIETELVPLNIPTAPQTLANETIQTATMYPVLGLGNDHRTWAWLPGKGAIWVS